MSSTPTKSVSARAFVSSESARRKHFGKRPKELGDEGEKREMDDKTMEVELKLSICPTQHLWPNPVVEFSTQGDAITAKGLHWSRNHDAAAWMRDYAAKAWPT
jgi:hypothetical protein